MLISEHLKPGLSIKVCTTCAWQGIGPDASEGDGFVPVVFSFCRLNHRRFKPVTGEPQYPPANDPLGHQLEQIVVRNSIEACLKIRIHYIRVSAAPHLSPPCRRVTLFLRHVWRARPACARTRTGRQAPGGDTTPSWSISPSVSMMTRVSLILPSWKRSTTMPHTSTERPVRQARRNREARAFTIRSTRAGPLPAPVEVLRPGGLFAFPVLPRPGSAAFLGGNQMLNP